MKKSTSNSTEQDQVLQLMKSYKVLHGELPSLGYIAAQRGYKYKSQAQYHFKAIKEKGLLDITNPVSMRDIPLVGNVSCGPALLAEENIEAYIPVDEASLRNKNSKYFFLRAEGDSMNEVGVNPGDFVLIRQQATAHNREIVVALIGDDATLKELGKTDDGIPVLAPRSINPVHKPRIMLEDFSILGVMERILTPSQGGYAM